ncbi:glycosyl hydrolase family protein 43 [Tanacetum coccineum]|uniref:Glycosyl hydrolase family protein 43 n=1 Tax=Tanacetum coccineum TaxID=301880 RepID=A0ABQ5I958_9ASTR
MERNPRKEKWTKAYRRLHNKDMTHVDIIGVGCYSFKDLCTWKNEVKVLAAEETDDTHDLHKSNVLERPKVIYNETTGIYIMWMHIDDTTYTRAAARTAISSSPTSPFDYINALDHIGKQTWWYRVKSDTLTREDAELRFFVCQASNLGGIE